MLGFSKLNVRMSGQGCGRQPGDFLDETGGQAGRERKRVWLHSPADLDLTLALILGCAFWIHYLFSLTIASSKIGIIMGPTIEG